MFQLAFGVSRSCFRGLKNPKEELKIPDAPNRALDSDTDEEDEEPGFLAPKAPLTSRLSRLSILCRASVRARDACRKKGCWPDGKPIGRGHGQPYLAPQWAIKIADGSKRKWMCRSLLSHSCVASRRVVISCHLRVECVRPSCIEVDGVGEGRVSPHGTRQGPRVGVQSIIGLYLFQRREQRIHVSAASRQSVR